jgi:hypothetical protein
MYTVPQSPAAFRLIGRNGSTWEYRDLAALARVLVDGRFYTHGGVYGLHTDIVERFTTDCDPATGRRVPDGHYVVEDAVGDRVSREVIAEACVAHRLALRRKSRAGGRGWYRKPRRHKIVTCFDNRHALHDRLDLAEIDPRWARLVGAKVHIDDPYEAAPRRCPQRSWKRHRATQYR